MFCRDKNTLASQLATILDTELLVLTLPYKSPSNYGGHLQEGADFYNCHFQAVHVSFSFFSYLELCNVQYYIVVLDLII